MNVFPKCEHNTSFNNVNRVNNIVKGTKERKIESQNSTKSQLLLPPNPPLSSIVSSLVLTNESLIHIRLEDDENSSRQKGINLPKEPEEQPNCLRRHHHRRSSFVRKSMPKDCRLIIINFRQNSLFSAVGLFMAGNINLAWFFSHSTTVRRRQEIE